MTWLDILIQFIIPALGAVVTYYIVPLLKEKNLYRYVTIGVYAAEQLFGSEAGADKFEYVQTWIKDKFKVSDEDLKNIIEAVVLEMNNAAAKE